MKWESLTRWKKDNVQNDSSAQTRVDFVPPSFSINGNYSSGIQEEYNEIYDKIGEHIYTSLLIRLNKDKQREIISFHSSQFTYDALVSCSQGV